MRRARQLQVKEGTLSSKPWYRAAQMNAVHAIKVKGNFMFDSANHRDFLGACMGCGIERSKVGDILVQGEQGAQILLVPELVPHLEMQLTQVSTSSQTAACTRASTCTLQFIAETQRCKFAIFIYLLSGTLHAQCMRDNKLCNRNSRMEQRLHLFTGVCLACPYCDQDTFRHS